jgi:hypothetical protein
LCIAAKAAAHTVCSGHAEIEARARARAHSFGAHVENNRCSLPQAGNAVSGLRGAEGISESGFEIELRKHVHAHRHSTAVKLLHYDVNHIFFFWPPISAH